jgi:hypothetical protein
MTVTGRAGHSGTRSEIERTAAMHPAASVAANFRISDNGSVSNTI